MPLFEYTALSPNGNLIKEEGVFASPEELYYSLQREGLLLLDYKAKRGFSLVPTKIKRKEIAEFLHQLSFILKSGIPLITGLEELEKEIKNSKLRKNVITLRKKILSGENFATALRDCKIFPPIVISLAQIGENTGSLDKTLEDASKHLYRIDEIISNTKRALIYPIFVLVAMLGALAFWFFFVLPQILKVFQEMNIKLPLPTLMLIRMVNFLQSIKYLIPFIIIICIALLFFIYKHPKTQGSFDKFLLKIPIFGRIKRLNFLAFFYEHFALMLNAGLDLLRVLNLLKDAFNRIYFQKIVNRIKETILRGEPIAQALRIEPIFTALDIRMVSIGETTGRLNEQMQMLADFYYTEVKNLVDTLTKLLEPLVLVIAGIIFLIIIIGLIGPIYDLISQVGKT